jgi:PAS domain S-box-containing protein
MLLAVKEAAFFTPERMAMLSHVARQLQASVHQARLSRELTEQTADLQAVIGSLSDALVEVTADRSVLQANAAACELLGVKAGGRRADDWHSLVPLFDLHKDEPAGDRHPVARTFTQACTQRASQWRLMRAGKTVYVSATAAPIVDDKNARVRAVVLLLRDVSEQRAAEQKLLWAEKHASVSSLASGVAHEFKNYLGGIMGNAGLAQQLAGENEVASTALQRIVEIGNRANQTALSLLSYVRDSGDHPQVLDLANLTGEVICLCEQRALKQGIGIERRLALDICVEGVATKVRQILLNLVENAVEAMPQGGTLSVILSGSAEQATLVIADTGIGIPQENLGKVFDPFFSTKGVWGSETGDGTGLGLTTCSNYVRELGGELSLESTAGKGTHVTVRLPRLRRARAQEPAAGTTPVARRAIVLETDAATRELLAEVLTSQSWQVTVVAGARELETGVEELAPGVAFLDALLPGKINFIRAFEALQTKTPNCLIVVTTGAATDYQLSEYLQAASARLTKPLLADQLQHFVATLSGVPVGA